MTKKAKQNITTQLNNNSFQLISINEIKPNPTNCRKYSEKQISMLTASINEFGMNVPIIVDGNLVVLAGHARLLATRAAGLETVPIIILRHLTKNQKRSFTIADNKISELAEWNLDKLSQELREIVEECLDIGVEFNIDALGISTAELDALISTPFLSDNNEETVDITRAIANRDKPAICKTGDIWHLGKHIIICGSSTELDSYKKLFKDKKVKLICADPPYNVKIDSFVSGNGKQKHNEFKNASGEMSLDEYTTFLASFLNNSTHHAADGTLIYVFMDWRHDRELQSAADKAKLKQINLCMWDKQSGGLGSLYRSQHELIYVYKHGKSTHTNNIMLGKHGRNRTNVWSYPSAIRTEEGRKALKDHPTPKPVPMIMDIMYDVTSINDIVFDPFLGSGTTVLAAEKTKRICYGIEIDPYYVDCTIRRWQSLTGISAMNAKTGKTFSQHETLIPTTKVKGVARDR